MINAINLIDVLGTSKRELSEVINNIDHYYYNFRQAKTKYGEEQKRGSRILFRELWPSQFALKRIQKRINLLLQMKELPEYVYGSVRGSNNFLNALAHIENKYFFSVDLKNFFPNITHRQVFKMFVQQGFSSSAARKLTKLTTYRGSLPQGAPTSPIISNLVFMETGQKLIEATWDHHITFTTFLDDLIFSSKNDFKSLVPQLLQIIKSGGFYIHHKKYTIKPGCRM